MGKVFHIGVGDDGNFAVTRMTVAPDVSAGPISYLKSQFGLGFDESAARHEAAMTHFPIPGNDPKI